MPRQTSSAAADNIAPRWIHASVAGGNLPIGAVMFVGPQPRLTTQPAAP